MVRQTEIVIVFNKNSDLATFFQPLGEETGSAA